MTNNSANSPRPERLSQSGQMTGWGVFGGLVLVGFFFGIVTGYEAPKPVVVAKAPREKEPAKPETPKPAPKVTQEPQPLPKEEPPPKQEPPKIETPKVVTPPPKKDPPKPEVVKSVSFQKDVLPIFRTYCLNCHGSTGKPKGDVDLRTIAAIIDPKNPPILTVGKPEKSAIFLAIQDNAMPPEGKRPGKGELDVIRDWIAGGAKPRRRHIRTRTGSGPR